MKVLLLLGCIVMFLAVALGAFGAHALKKTFRRHDEHIPDRNSISNCSRFGFVAAGSSCRQPCPFFSYCNRRLGYAGGHSSVFRQSVCS